MARALQDGPPTEPAPEGKEWKKTSKDVDGHPVDHWILVDKDDGGPTWPARERLSLLNKDIERVDGAEKVTGAAVYSHDVRLEGMLYAVVLPAAIPQGTYSLDLDAARAVDGVVVAQDVAGGEVRYLGQAVAAVAGITPDHARDGLRALGVEFEAGEWALTREQAMAEGAPAIGRRGNRRSGRARGDSDATRAALESAAAAVEAEYTLPVQHHVCLETHGVVVDYRGGGEATVYASTQGTFTIGSEAAGTLGLRDSDVTAVVEHMGGGFGSKFGLDIPGDIACRLALEAERPVHLLLDRKGESSFVGNRSGGWQRVKAGCDETGKLVALDAEIETYGGLGRGSNPGLPYIYDAQEYSRVQASVMTNTDSSRAMRAPGHPQASFAMESILDELAYEAGLDPLELRKTNLSDPVYHRQLDRVAAEIGWSEHPNRTAPGTGDGWTATGIGFGVATWGGGGRPVCEVDVKISSDGSVTVEVGTQDLGTGVRTYVAAIVAEELGLQVEQVTPRIGSSRYGAANASGGSVTTACLAPSVKAAAWAVRRSFLEKVAGARGVDSGQLKCADGAVHDLSSAAGKLSWSAACALLPSEGVAERGKWNHKLAGNGVHGAQGAKVEVDLKTGQVQVLEMVAVQDCGLPLNHLALRSQLNGGMIQALGYALLEERVLDPELGLNLNPNMEDYKIPGSMQMPLMKAIVDEEDDRQVVIGMSEAAVIPGASAIANAVHNACGARVRELPLTPDKVLAALGRV
ncbi:MAG: xanthine dehydrogenase family protein molybdopterin-binding subunit [Planctomycetes bacterium]|nr:xanthine dehydrogenase family protein molybdopterin-binding subunit [Planctomycetota bacterium]